MKMNSYRSSHFLACAVVLWMMLLVSAATTDLYYERPENDSEYQIENKNKEEPVLTFDGLERTGEDLRRNEILVTMLQYAEKLKDTDNKGPSPIFEVKDLTWSELEGLKDAGVKKWVTVLSKNVSSKLLPRNRPQLKWKIKKGTTVLCYFKLCSFKQPV